MALRQRFEVIYDTEYLPFSYVFQKHRDANIQEFLDAVCAEMGHDWPVHISLGMPSARKPGPCRRCGVIDDQP